MRNESGAAATGAANPMTATGVEPTPVSTATAWLAVPALVWLAVMLRSALVSLRSPGDTALNVTEAAIGLPAVTSAALVSGAAVGLALLRLFGRRLIGPATRFAVAIAAGTVTGIASAATIVVGRQDDGSAIMVLGAVIAAGATIGGALAGVRATGIVAAGVAASLSIFLFTLVRAFFDSELLDIFGAGETAISVLDAQQRLAWVAATLGGLLAGSVAFAYLRRVTRHIAVPPRWPAYLVAGGSVGAMLLITELITRIGGARVIELARSVSQSDDLFQDMAEAARINSALVVLFVGALTAMIAFGRTLRPANERETQPTGEPAAERKGQPAGERKVAG